MCIVFRRKFGKFRIKQKLGKMMKLMVRTTSLTFYTYYLFIFIVYNRSLYFLLYIYLKLDLYVQNFANF